MYYLLIIHFDIYLLVEKFQAFQFDFTIRKLPFQTAMDCYNTRIIRRHRIYYSTGVVNS